MERKVIGLFDERNHALAVQRDLVAAGFEDAHISVSNRYSEPLSDEDKGFWQRLKEFFTGDDDVHYTEFARRGGTLVVVNVPENQVDRVIEIMRRHNPVDLNKRIEQWRSSGWKHQSQATGRTTGATANVNLREGQTQTSGRARNLEQGEAVLPVVEEQINISKRQAEGAGGVRIHQKVTERPVEEQVTLHEERINVERRPADRAVQPGDLRDQTIEAREYREEAVVNKTARVVEEVVVNKEARDRTETVRDSVKRTDVEVERIDSFANEYATNDQYRGKDWTAIESNVRTDFERRHPGSRWDDVKDRVRASYDRARSGARS
jgi:stress response protein YsnF